MASRSASTAEFECSRSSYDFCVPGTVAPEDLTFERPFELTAVARWHERDLIDAASQHGLLMEHGDVVVAARRAAASGALRSADVVIPGRRRPMTVVDGTTFVDEMSAYFG